MSALWMNLVGYQTRADYLFHPCSALERLGTWIPKIKRVNPQPTIECFSPPATVHVSTACRGGEKV
eukprot:1669393-Amphidinium_carterae.1